MKEIYESEIFKSQSEIVTGVVSDTLREANSIFDAYLRLRIERSFRSALEK